MVFPLLLNPTSSDATAESLGNSEYDNVRIL